MNKRWRAEDCRLASTGVTVDRAIGWRLKSIFYKRHIISHNSSNWYWFISAEIYKAKSRFKVSWFKIFLYFFHLFLSWPKPHINNVKLFLIWVFPTFKRWKLVQFPQASILFITSSHFVCLFISRDWNLSYFMTSICPSYPVISPLLSEPSEFSAAHTYKSVVLQLQ
jgi:hypothetical protein